ncbi:MAG: GntR family transcriptional regulator [Chloroflexi bacterium]|nr:MAG: GntR family transcriptional regulator [Chloroflexota bacterium]
MFLDKQHPRPVYLQLKEMLQSRIEQGCYLSHQQLPSERDLCQNHNLSRMTVRKALQSLIADGLAYTRAGKGYFVSDLSGVAGNSSGGHAHGSSRVDEQILQANYRKMLIDPLISFDCVATETAINKLLSTHSLETVAGGFFPEIINYLEARWQAGKVSLQAYHYAITTLRSHLVAMVNASALPRSGSKVLLGCAPGDQHDIGLLLLALNLRRRGFVVIFMGSMLTAHEFQQVIETARPQVIGLSAATQEAAEKLDLLSRQCLAMQVVAGEETRLHKAAFKPVFTFGGVAFSRNPERVSAISGIYLGATVEQAVSTIQRLAAV